MSDPDTVARVVYLVLLLCFLLGFFAWRRGQIGRRLRDLSVWVLIFAMVVIAYGFRDVLRRELFPAAMVQVSEDAIELRRGSDGHFHATVEVNGQPVRFLVDTGASGIVLSRQWSRSTSENGGKAVRSTRRSGSHRPERITAFEHWK